MQDELGRITIRTAGCYTALGVPAQCVTEGIFDLRWESQLQVQRLDVLTASCGRLAPLTGFRQARLTLNSCLPVICTLTSISTSSTMASVWLPPCQAWRALGSVCSLQNARHVQAMLDILRILTAVLALGLGAWLFNRDTKRLVLVPIDRMMQKVRRLQSRGGTQ